MSNIYAPHKRQSGHRTRRDRSVFADASMAIEGAGDAALTLLRCLKRIPSERQVAEQVSRFLRDHGSPEWRRWMPFGER